MKKFISVLLVLSMLLATLIPVSAQDAFEAPEIDTGSAEKIDCEYPIIFVTGIGQTWTHLVNEDGSYKLDKDGDPIEYNLFYADAKGLLKPKALLGTLALVGEILASAILDINLVRQKDVEALFGGLLHYNIIDKEGKLPSDVEDCVKPYPLSEYNELDEKNFYRSIPCQSIVEQIGAENIYSFNHSAFDFLYDDAEGLHTFIQTILKQHPGKDKVVLIPMSMGAAVVNAYLDRYPDANEVKRVVSIVGCWNGSDVVADLIEKKYVDNAPELLYNGIIAELIGEPWGYLVNVVIRIFPKKTLRGIIDTALAGVGNAMLLRTPSLMALVPAERYEAIEKEYLAGDDWAYIREQTHPYYEAQKNLKSRLSALEQKGIEFYFLSGYGLQYGGFSDDYKFFQFMRSSATTNSDEIIHIASTAPGTTYAPYNGSLGYTGKYVSPDGTIDVSTSFAPDRTWCFYGQKHELEYNNTALRLALDISVGRVNSVEGSKDTYPQFNESRDVKKLTRGDDTYIILLSKFIAANKDDASKAADVALAQKALDACNAVLNSTKNDRDADDAVMEDAYNTLVQIGIYKAPAPEKEPSKGAQFLKKLNDKVYDFFGAKGFIDKVYDLF